jgi:hypothetical protein
MALVTLDAAMTHLRASDADAGDVYDKLEQATGIVLDYLKGRAGKVATIVSSSVANPTVMTTAAAHTFVNGETAVLVGHAGSVPAISGSYVVSGVTERSFTIPVNVSTAGTGGTATVAWTDATVPWPVKAAVLVALTHLYENRGNDMRADADVWEALRRLLERARDPAYA